MCSDLLRRLTALTLLAGMAAIGSLTLLAQDPRETPRFFPDDPLLVDDDAAFDASGVKERELSEGYDFLTNTFASPGDRSPIRAVNVNTLDEVPDSSWFTNRIGVRDMPLAEIARGPNKFERLEATEWTVVRGKGPGGFHPGFRASHPGDPKQVYQLEVDPVGRPQMASGAELIGTLVYHALGYHVEDVYAIKVDPSRIQISEKATVRDASGTRPFTRSDLADVLRQAARDRAGHVYMSATRFEEGEAIGHFRYHGTRSDDPNDIHPHEHRRELRANRVFAAWLAHDDSRAVNTLNLLVTANGRKHVRHYMYDFGAILGSATRFAEPATNNHEYFLDKGASLKALGSLGLSVPRYLRVDRPDEVPSAGKFDSESFDPERWKPNYPNPAFASMRPDDAFWGARLVSRFSNEIIRAIVGQVNYDDPRTTEYLARRLIDRRVAIARTWLNGVNPVVDFALASDGMLTFANAAVAAGAATPAKGYKVAWSRFDNESGRLDAEGAAVETAELRAGAPPSLLAGSDFIAATVTAEHPDYPAWRQPVRVFFRRTETGWKTVGLYR